MNARYMINYFPLIFFLFSAYTTLVPKCLVIARPVTFGVTVTDELLNRGEQVTLFTSESAQARNVFAHPHLTIVQGSIDRDQQALQNLINDATHIFFCPHYPVYTQWESRLPREVTKLLALVGKQHVVYFPSINYVVGKDQRFYTEQSTVNPCSAIGRAYKQAEDLFVQAGQQKVCSTVVVRHPLPFGPRFVDGLTSKIFCNVVKGKKMEWVCRLDKGYQFCYAPDVARCMIELGNKAGGTSYFIQHGGYTFSMVKDWLEYIAQRAGVKCRTKVFGKWLIRFGSFFHPDARSAKDILYSFEQLVALRDDLLFKTLPSFAYTPFDTALTESLTWARTLS